MQTSILKYLPFGLILLASCGTGTTEKPVDSEAGTITTPAIPAPASIGLQISAAYPHDDSAYTQGLEVYGGKIYESTGDFANSSIRIYDIKTGKIIKKHVMGTKEIFGEGITIFRNKIYQLTWQNNLVNVYDLNKIDKPEKTFSWPLEGWGITHHADELIISDGSANIFFVNPDDFKIKRTIQVIDQQGPVDNLNELEMIDGFLYANVYMKDHIVKIDLSNGHVVGRIDLPGLIRQYAPQFNPKEGEVLNGIAYDSTSRKVYITGKHWPKLFEASIR
jgi:glutamine cyclotransferase